MSGTVITILEKTDFDFGVLAANITVADSPLAQDIDISRYKEVVMLIRVHAKSMTQTG